MLQSKDDTNLEVIDMYETYKGEAIADITPGRHQVYLRMGDRIIELENVMDIEAEMDFDGSSKISITGTSMTFHQLHPMVLDNLKLHSPRSGKDYSLSMLEFYGAKRKPKAEKVIFSGPATTIIWTDGSKTTVKCSNKDVYDEDVGIAMCYLKKLYGNEGNYNNIFREAMKVREEK